MYDIRWIGEEDFELQRVDGAKPPRPGWERHSTIPTKAAEKIQSSKTPMPTKVDELEAKIEELEGRLRNLEKTKVG